jgi:penicillin-binding protein 1B
MFKKIIKYALLIILLCAIGITLYGWYSSTLIEERFSARRWSIPSTVYSDTTLLYPGQRLNPELFRKKLLNLEYRPVSELPEKKGEIHFSAASIDIFLHDLQTPWQKRSGFLVRLLFDENQIRRIKNLDNGSDLPILELEPERYPGILSTQYWQRKTVAFTSTTVSIRAGFCEPFSPTFAMRKLSRVAQRSPSSLLKITS